MATDGRNGDGDAPGSAGSAGSTDGSGDLAFDGERFIPGVGVGIAYEHLLRYALAAELSAGLDVLDVGSGEGYGSAVLAGRARTVTGFDASAAAVEHARRRYSRDAVTFERATLRSFFEGSADARFDVAVAFEVIEHVPMEEQALLLEGLRRVLRPDGFAIVSTPDKLHYTDKPLNANRFHVREYYRDEFAAELRKHFSEVKLLEQAQLTGCAVFSRGARTASLAEMRWTNLVTNEGRTRPEISTDGEFLVAVAGNGTLPEVPSLVLVDFSRKAIAEALRVYREEVERLTAALHDTRRAHEEAVAELERARRETAEIMAQRSGP